MDSYWKVYEILQNGEKLFIGEYFDKDIIEVCNWLRERLNLSELEDLRTYYEMKRYS